MTVGIKGADGGSTIAYLTVSENSELPIALIALNLNL